jgi:hypothetical protein
MKNKGVVIFAGDIEGQVLMHHLRGKGKFAAVIFGSQTDKGAVLAMNSCASWKQDFFDFLTPLAIPLVSPNDKYSGPDGTLLPDHPLLEFAHALSVASAIKAPAIYYAWTKSTRLPLGKQTLKLLNSIGAVNPKNPVRAEAPFLKMTREAVFNLGLSLGVDYARTWSCEKAAKCGDFPEVACGKCRGCLDRAALFAKVGMRDPVAHKKGSIDDSAIASEKKRASKGKS